MSSNIPEPLLNMVDAIPSKISHVIGATSGLTGIALYAEWAKHLTAIGGLIVVFLSIIGATFYGLYWVVKFLKELRELKNK